MKNEFQKPDNYESGGADKMAEFMASNVIQLLFVLLLLVWVISSAWISIYDVFSGNFEYKTLSISFFSGISLAIYLQVKKTLKERKYKGPKSEKKKKGCSSCGK
jgi:hypothetical protein